MESMYTYVRTSHTYRYAYKHDNTTTMKEEYTTTNILRYGTYILNAVMHLLYIQIGKYHTTMKMHRGTVLYHTSTHEQEGIKQQLRIEMG